MNTATITIERDGSEFPVTVTPESPGIGWYEHPTDGAGDVRYVLTDAEQTLARESLTAANVTTPEPDDEPAVSAREADFAADAYAGYRNLPRP